MKPDTRDPSYPTVSMSEARSRLSKLKFGAYKAAHLAEVIWPGRTWRSQQGAGAAAVWVLKKLNADWGFSNHSWGWLCGGGRPQ